MRKVLGELEQKVMDVLWSQEQALKPAEVRTLLDNVPAYTTVMTILKRLHDKGLLQRQMQAGAYYYQAAVTREAFAENKLQSLFTGLINSYGQLAISEFLTSLNQDPNNAEALKQFLKSHLDE